MASDPIQLDPFQWRTHPALDDETRSIPPWTECQALKSQLMDLVLTEREAFLHASPRHPNPPYHEEDPNPSPTRFEPESTPRTSESGRVEADLKAVDKALRDLIRILDARVAAHSPMTEGDAPGLTKRKKRDKDFQTRWKRSLYDFTQKINQTKVAWLKLNICAETNRTPSENAASTKLHLALRQLVSVLKILLAQAPFLGSPFKESNVLIEMVERISEASNICSQLGYAHPDLASSLQGLKNVVGLTDEKQAQSLPIDPCRPTKTALPRIDLINNLAREKFGSSLDQSPKKTTNSNKAPPKSISLSKAFNLPAEAQSWVDPKERESDSASGFVLELSDYDLESIHQSRRRHVSSWDLMSDLPWVLSQSLVGGSILRGLDERGKKEQGSSNPVDIVRALSDDIVDHLVLQVCQEMTQDPLVSRLIDEELTNS